MVEASGYTLTQERALAICPKVASTISIPCSICIIYEVIYDFRTRGTTPVQRALMAMSCVDILASFGWFLSTWAVPEGSFAFAAGNQTSCNFQGFLLQLAIGAPLYNSSLALFYLLMIKMRWSNEHLARIEKGVHALILSFTIGTSILLLQLEQYNHIGAVCWVIGDPPGCGNSSYQDSDIPCERGDYAWAWGLALFYGPLWVCVIACCTSMVVLYLEVRKTHTRSRRYSTAIKGMKHSANKSGGDQTKVAVQAILYSLTFLITWMPSTLWSIAHWFNWSHYGLDIAAASAEPLQGLWNFLIFLKSRPQTVRKIRAVLHPLCPCLIAHPAAAMGSSEFATSFVTGLRRRMSLSGFSSFSSPSFRSFTFRNSGNRTTDLTDIAGGGRSQESFDAAAVAKDLVEEPSPSFEDEHVPTHVEPAPGVDFNQLSEMFQMSDSSDSDDSDDEQCFVIGGEQKKNQKPEDKVPFPYESETTVTTSHVYPLEGSKHEADVIDGEEQSKDRKSQEKTEDALKTSLPRFENVNESDVNQDEGAEKKRDINEENDGRTSKKSGRRVESESSKKTSHSDSLDTGTDETENTSCSDPSGTSVRVRFITNILSTLEEEYFYFS